MKENFFRVSSNDKKVIEYLLFLMDKHNSSFKKVAKEMRKKFNYDDVVKLVPKKQIKNIIAQKGWEKIWTIYLVEGDKIKEKIVKV